LTTTRHTVGGAPPPEAFLAQSHDNPAEWFLLGLTCALVVRKRRGLSRQFWRAYQDRSLKCSRLPSSEDCNLETKGLCQHQVSRRDTKVWRFHQATWRKRGLQANKSYPGSLDFSGPRLRLRSPLTRVEYFGHTR
jgi:hypothetical protein